MREGLGGEFVYKNWRGTRVELTGGDWGREGVVCCMTFSSCIVSITPSMDTSEYDRLDKCLTAIVPSKITNIAVTIIAFRCGFSFV